MKIFPSSSIKKLDAYTIEHEPIASIDLMERAAQALTKAITNRWNPETPVTIFAGPGNNGGDALAIARMMAEKGYKVEVFLFNTKGELSPDCQANKELVEIMDWTNTHVTSTIYLCWAAQAGLYHHYGLKKRKLDKKMFGLFWHKVMNRKIPLVRGFDDMFLAPHSRHTEVPIEDIHNCKELTVLAESDEAGLFLAMADGGRKIFVMGHPEYDRVTLDGEYKRDVSKNLPIEIPENYYKDNNPENRPLLMWRAHANNLYTNWLNYYVYQSTPFDLYGTPDFSEI